jgi:hypothetical protein
MVSSHTPCSSTRWRESAGLSNTYCLTTRQMAPYDIREMVLIVADDSAEKQSSIVRD